MSKKHQKDAKDQRADAAGEEPAPKMKRKEYERELRKLHAELVAMQESVKASGTKVCIVFEGRDSAGKGGTIKAITGRVSPRVFRVVALPSPTALAAESRLVGRGSVGMLEACRWTPNSNSSSSSALSSERSGSTTAQRNRSGACFQASASHRL